MKTILVPTDFSDTAKNAADYAAALACEIGATKIVLYNAYQAPVSADPSMPAVQLFDMDVLKKSSTDGLKHFKNELTSKCGDNVAIETKSEFQLLASGIENICKKEEIDIVVMGITGGSKMEEVLIGSNTISVAKHVHVPVIIVPHHAKYNSIKEIVLACDFKQVKETTPVDAIKRLLNITKAKFFILNVDSNNKDFTPETPHQNFVLENLFEGYHPEYHFINDKHFTDAINHFVDDNEVDLIITIPKKHGWFEGLFKRSHTKELAYHSHVPLMVVHE
jgi:nucleotide-binding universal stress UspA family protein